MVVMGALSRLGATQNPIITILRNSEVEFITTQNATVLLLVPGVWRDFDFEAMARSVAGAERFRVVVVDHLAGPAGELGLALPEGDVSCLPAPLGSGGEWIYYTSGTTAEPKGIRHSDRSLLASSAGMVDVLGLGADDVYPIAFPIAHVGGVSNLVAHLRTGAVMALCDRFDPIQSPAFMAEVGATFLGTATPFFHAFMAAQVEFGSQPLFPRLKACISGGAPKSVQLYEDVKDVLGGMGIIGSYGLTECPVATFGSPSDSDDELAHSEGRPVPGVTVRIVDSDGRQVPDGGEGEIRMSGPQMFSGYVDSSLDADAFDDDGFFRTGDLGRIGPRGHVAVTGRLKDIIIRNAENLSALEIEQVLVTHAAIADVAVIGVPDARAGERVCALVILASGWRGIELTELADHCRRVGLAAQKVPEYVVVVDTLPRNSLGKLQKVELRRRYADLQFSRDTHVDQH